MTEPKIYTIGWICLDFKDLAAASERLDETYGQAGHTLGKIGEHNVVVCCTPAGGPSSSAVASLTANMRFNFPSVQFILLVGVGDGVLGPTHDIRLGDIVVGSPYKNREGGFLFFRPSGDDNHLTIGFSRPPAPCCKGVAGLAAHISGQRIDEIIDGYRPKSRRLWANFKRPDGGTDDPYDLNGDDGYVMVSSPSCSDRDGHPVIHYGLIADQDCTLHDDLRVNRTYYASMWGQLGQ